VASPELIRSVNEHQRQLAQALVDKAKAICAEHGVCSSLARLPSFFLDPVCAR
jgi:hypothetical protein